MKKSIEIYERIDNLSAIKNIQEILFSPHVSSTKNIVDLVAFKIMELLDCRILEFAAYDETKDLLSNRYVYKEKQKLPEQLPACAPFGIWRQVTETKQMVISKEIRRRPKPDRSPDKLGSINNRQSINNPQSTIKPLILLPLTTSGMITGIISLQRDEGEGPFRKSEIKLLQIITSLLSSSIKTASFSEENLRLQKETEQQAVELTILNVIGEGLAQKLDYQAIIDLVGNKIQEIFNAQIVTISMYDPDKNTIHHLYVIEKGERYTFDKPQKTDPDREEIIRTRQPLVFGTSQEIIDHSGEGVIAGDMPESYLGVPIIYHQEVTGVITVQDVDRKYLYNDKDIRLLLTLASNMGVALENARLFEETKHLLSESEQRTAELSILNTIQQGLVMEMSFEGIINLVGDKLRETLNFQDIGIRIYDKETNLFYYPYEYEHGEKLILEPNPPGPISGWVLKNKALLLLRNQKDEELRNLGIVGNTVIPGTDRSRSMVALPIMAGDEVCGLFSVENYEKEDAFNESDIRLFTTLASSMSIALQNAKLFEETKRLLNESNKREAELITVNSISQALTTHLELDKLINLVGNRIRELFKAQIVYLALLDKETDTINFPYGCGDEFPPMKLGEGLTSKIISTGQPLLINRKMEERRAELGIKRIGIPATSYLGVPIPVGEEIIGVISIQSTEQENYFSKDDMRLLNTIAANIGVALNNAEAYEKLNLTVEQLNKALNDLKSTQQQLIVQEKLASLGTLTAGIAHEIKNPLNFVNNFAEISIELTDEIKEKLEKLKVYIPSGEYDEIDDLIREIKENAVRINQHGKRADSIVRSMLQHSRGKAGELQETDINSILEEDLNLAYHGMRARDSSFNATIEKDFDTTIPKISIIPQDISRVFINVINNGFYEVNKKAKAIKDNFKPTVRITTRNLGDKIEVRIKDNGNGISADIQDKLFNPFFTTKPSGEGTGLGLSLSYDIIVKQHQGEISFDTISGEFSEFIISLPKISSSVKNK